jgi:hypothetical protein
MNYVRRNVAAGSTHYGFWFRPLAKPDGLSTARGSGICPNMSPLGAFEDNVAHSLGK